MVPLTGTANDRVPLTGTANHRVPLTGTANDRLGSSTRGQRGTRLGGT